MGGITLLRGSPQDRELLLVTAGLGCGTGLLMGRRRGQDLLPWRGVPRLVSALPQVKGGSSPSLRLQASDPSLGTALVPGCSPSRPLFRGPLRGCLTGSFQGLTAAGRGRAQCWLAGPSGHCSLSHWTINRGLWPAVVQPWDAPGPLRATRMDPQAAPRPQAGTCRGHAAAARAAPG